MIDGGSCRRKNAKHLHHLAYLNHYCDLSADNAAKEIGCNYRCFESEKAGQGEKLNERVGEAVCRKRVYNEYGFGHLGTIKEVADGGVIVEKKDGIEAVNLEYITRIREWPRNARGKKKQIFA